MLNTLDVSSNNFSGHIPESLLAGHCGLSMLYLRKNPLLSGTIPNSISTCSELDVLTMDILPRISGTLPSMPSVQCIFIGTSFHNRADVIPPSRLSGSIPSSLVNSPNLKVLLAHGVPKMTATISGAAPLRKLSVASLIGFAALEGTVGRTLSQATALIGWAVESRAPAGRTLSGTLPAVFASKKLILEISFTRTGISGTLPSSLANSMQSFIVRDSYLSGVIPATLRSNGSKLNQIVLNSNSLSGSLPRNLALGGLTGLDVALNRLSGTIPMLCSLDFCAANRTDSIDPLTNKSSEVKILDLAVNRISGTVPPHIFQHTLETVSYTHLTLPTKRIV
eukprot:TRINITY_DN16853_c0_g1_i2.p1 TRINITY_DN16853_c0_g1~~TRINITY_DN16853_c0_g1_i2.p1  ORF type:complete len:337 (-),score=20.24 TRINITY_DN16853_c0_g1_i2:93-1103(-)